MQKFRRQSLRANFYYPFGNIESVGLKAFYTIEYNGYRICVDIMTGDEL